jgi:hypothetical protein
MTKDRSVKIPQIQARILMAVPLGMGGAAELSPRGVRVTALHAWRLRRSAAAAEVRRRNGGYAAYPATWFVRSAQARGSDAQKNRHELTLISA